jgi:hypothetical protein
MKRSVLAIFCGVAIIGVLSLGADSAVRGIASGAFGADGFSAEGGLLLIMLGYTSFFSGIGGWVTAAISRRPDQRDIRILAGLQFLFTLAANIMLWDRRLAWFYAAGLVLTPISILLGGRIPAARQRETPQPGTMRS